MPTKTVQFIYYSGVFGDAFPRISATLEGSWDEQGIYSDNWSAVDMKKVESPDGSFCYRAFVLLDLSQSGTTFHWGVRFHDLQAGTSIWAIPTEVKSTESRERHRTFLFDGMARTERYYLTYCRRMGANKVRNADGTWGVRFRVWAPNARNVELVFGSIWNIEDPAKSPVGPENPVERGKIAGGYISNDGTGTHLTLPEIPMNKTDDFVWETPTDHPVLRDLSMIKHRLYMYRVTWEDGSKVYRTDLYSRCQAGSGAYDPQGTPYEGLLSELEGRVSCSVTVDPEKVVKTFDVPVWPEPREEFISVENFWADEFTNKLVPKRVEDLIIYELHLGALGFGSDRPGTLKDAIKLLDHITGLNVNAIELLPLSEFAGGAQNWGYATSHYFAIEYGGGGRDQFKHFVKECHRRGLAVIMDVVYNHYDHNADRAERYYDSPKPEHDIYYWYEGQSSDYEYLRNQGNQYWNENWPRGGYLDNLSTGDAPAYHQEMVRKMFISSAVSLMEEFHIDGFRVDQTTSIHQYNKIRATGNEASDANIFGAKFLREFGRTLRLFRPGIMLIAEDHSDWDEVTMPAEQGGMGFDARWYSAYYHHLIGDTQVSDRGKAKLLIAAANKEAELRFDWFSRILWNTQFQKIVYNESHDEAGNSTGPFYDFDWDPEKDGKDNHHTSERTINVAVNSAPLLGATRKYAEARCRFAWGVTVLSAGTPMFLFGEEVGAEKRFKYSAVLDNKEDLHGMREGSGKHLYTFYSDVNALRLKCSGLRSRNIDIIHERNDTRVIVFRRWDSGESFLIFASLADYPFASGYVVNNSRIESGAWTEVFNSDSASYGGDNIGNAGQTISCINGRIEVAIPFAGFVVFAHERNSDL